MAERDQVGHLSVVERMLSNMAGLMTDSVSPDLVCGTEVRDY
jgi:hypothetical protein